MGCYSSLLNQLVAAVIVNHLTLLCAVPSHLSLPPCSFYTGIWARTLRLKTCPIWQPSCESISCGGMCAVSAVLCPPR